jgi:hypothetical protein
MRADIVFHNALGNIFVNLCECLKKMNNTYYLLRDQGGFDDLLYGFDDIYKNLENDESDAFLFLLQGTRFRYLIAHEVESDPVAEMQNIEDIISIYILSDQYLKPTQDLIFDFGYKSTLKSDLPFIPAESQSRQLRTNLLIIKDIDVNLDYEYEDVDINAILDAYVQHNRARLPNLEIIGAVDNIYPAQLEDRLRHAQENYRGRTLLIPYNLGNYHWVGLLVELDETGQPRRAICCDPLGTNKETLKSIDKYFKRVFPTCEINYVNYLRQSDATSCGAVTIDNLLMLAASSKTTEFRLSREDTAQIRSGHIEMLRLHRPDYAERFNRKQRENRPTVASFAEQFAYQESLKNVKFSAKEAEVIIELATYIENLESPEIKELLKQALLYNDAYKDNVKTHLDNIRNAINLALPANKSAKDQHAIIELADMFIGVEEMIHNKQEDWEFRLHYQMLLAIGNLVNKKDISLSDLQVNVKRQIAEDELLARQLQ